MERTFLMIKPDGVQRNLVGEIIQRFETKGFTLVGLKMMQVSSELAEKHYAVHKERPFWQGEGVIASARKIIGATNPLNAEPGTIRGDFGISVGRNLIHGSDGPDTAKDEVSLWFSDAELANWTPAITPWVVE
ncbi:MAG: nucleoside-diphosphate kinase [Microcystis aeruginosa Ma_QC_Ch_20071001_M135]|nr:MAG: nucleoside-diphosphate kinase [Microcystis aeruginosa Ma_QC_Ch_20071001_M135]